MIRDAWRSRLVLVVSSASLIDTIWLIATCSIGPRVDLRIWLGQGWLFGRMLRGGFGPTTNCSCGRRVTSQSWTAADGPTIGHFLPNNAAAIRVMYYDCIESRAPVPICPRGIWRYDGASSYDDQCSWSQCLNWSRSSFGIWSAAVDALIASGDFEWSASVPPVEDAGRCQLNQAGGENFRRGPRQERRRHRSAELAGAPASATIVAEAALAFCLPGQLIGTRD